MGITKSSCTCYFKYIFFIISHLFKFTVCSYDPACRNVSPGGRDISMRSYGVFHPACRDEILLLALAKHIIHFSHATQLFNDFSVFLYLFARKSIALARYLILAIQPASFSGLMSYAFRKGV